MTDKTWSNTLWKQQALIIAQTPYSLKGEIQAIGVQSNSLPCSRWKRDTGRAKEYEPERQREKKEHKEQKKKKRKKEEMKGIHLGSFSGFIEVTNPYFCTEAKIITCDVSYSVSGQILQKRE